MKVWIAVLALLLLVALIFRERYTNYEEALKDVGQTAGYITPKCESGYTINSEQSSCEKTKEDGTKETKTPTCPSGSSFTTNGPRGVCEPSATPEATGTTTSSQTSSSAPVGEDAVPPVCTISSATFNPATGNCESRNPDGTTRLSSASCPPNYTRAIDGRKVCVRSPGSQATSVPASSSTTTSSAASVATGGSSGNLIGPTSGGVGRTGKNVWGPVFTGLGESAAMGGDSTKTNKYPGLLGGMMGRESSRIDGVGIVSPSQPGFGLDMGALPSLSSLGTEANARFFPFSRPGADPGFTADPYGLAKSYSTKNLSPKPDPVPFLTDFSAFFR